MRVFNANVTKVVDGDTVNFDFAGEPSIALPKAVLKKKSIRFFGTDAPESDFEGQSQGEIAVKAKEHLGKLLRVGDEIQILTAVDVSDGYGRILGRILKGGEGRKPAHGEGRLGGNVPDIPEPSKLRKVQGSVQASDR